MSGQPEAPPFLNVLPEESRDPIYFVSSCNPGLSRLMGSLDIILDDFDFMLIVPGHWMERLYCVNGEHYYDESEFCAEDFDSDEDEVKIEIKPENYYLQRMLEGYGAYSLDPQWHIVEIEGQRYGIGITYHA